jgi:hypothetical protein
LFATKNEQIKDPLKIRLSISLDNSLTSVDKNIQFSVCKTIKLISPIEIGNI